MDETDYLKCRSAKAQKTVVDRDHDYIGKCHTCAVCKQRFQSISNCNRHVRKVHKVEPIDRSESPTLKCPLCDVHVPTYVNLDEHLKNHHEVAVTKEALEFPTLELFEKWKACMERETHSSYIVFSTRSMNGQKVRKYKCHRSGRYVPRNRDKKVRESKSSGSVKINCMCPARVTALEEPNGEVLVEYVPTHAGHEQEVSRLRLSNADRDAIAGLLIQGVNTENILKDIKSSFNPMRRLSYLTRRDIHNIRLSFNSRSEIILRQEDAMYVNLIVEKLRKCGDNPILAYKPVGFYDPVLPISSREFFFAFMNSTQQELLEIYGDEVVMVDSLHGTDRGKIQLTTLMVENEKSEGLPVAFLWSTLQSDETHLRFLKLVQQRVTSLRSKIFMSDDSNASYDAFCKVFNHMPKKYICEWAIKKSLCENLRKIKHQGKRQEMKKNIDIIVEEDDIPTFHRLLETTIQKLKTDDDTSAYGVCLETQYRDRCEQWAHCYRKSISPNTDAALQKWYIELKHNPRLEGKRLQRLDVSINNVIECLKDRVMTHLASLTRGEILGKQRDIRKRHTDSFLVDKTIITQQGDRTWLLQSATTPTAIETFTVKFETNKCNCGIVCHECKACLHVYSCNCYDHLLQYTMCKHIHLVCRTFPRPVIEPDVSETNSVDEEDIKIDHIPPDDIFEESVVMGDDITLDLQQTNIEMEKAATIDELNVLINSLQTWTELHYVKERINRIFPGLDMLRARELALKTPNVTCQDDEKTDKQQQIVTVKSTTKRKHSSDELET